MRLASGVGVEFSECVYSTPFLDVSQCQVHAGSGSVQHGNFIIMTLFYRKGHSKDTACSHNGYFQLTVVLTCNILELTVFHYIEGEGNLGSAWEEGSDCVGRGCVCGLSSLGGAAL